MGGRRLHLSWEADVALGSSVRLVTRILIIIIIKPLAEEEEALGLVGHRLGFRRALRLPGDVGAVAVVAAV